jgi:DNA recombination protein RmuC
MISADILVVLLPAVTVVLLLAVLWLLTSRHPGAAQSEELRRGQEEMERRLRDEFERGRDEAQRQAQALREEVLKSIANLGDLFATRAETQTRTVDERMEQARTGMETRLSAFSQETGAGFKELREGVFNTLNTMSEQQKAEIERLRGSVDQGLGKIREENENKLEQMRQTVEEKLQGTLEARLGESFKQVSERLEQVHKGLGEMQTLASGVGDLKKVLTNVKTRGTWGEVQLGNLLEQILSPGQFEKNVATRGGGERVEYAIKLPGRNHGEDEECVWLPIDAKFPVEDYQRLVEASETGDADSLERASKQLESSLTKAAKDISGKYIEAPKTTDFAIMFLSTEGLYAEAVRRAGLCETLQRDHRVLVSGPSTLAALLNSLQMGFQTLAIQKRSSEVEKLLGTVKYEFEKYTQVLAKVRKKLTEASNTIEDAETRTRVIERKLRQVQAGEEQQELGLEIEMPLRLTGTDDEGAS